MPIVRPLTVAAFFSILSVAISSWFYIGVFILLFDARSRYLDYKKHQHLEWNPHLGNKFKRSWCSRGVAQCIWGEDAKKYFKEHDYKFYHVLPDRFPLILFTLKFWKSVFYGLGYSQFS